MNLLELFSENQTESFETRLQAIPVIANEFINKNFLCTMCKGEEIVPMPVTFIARNDQNTRQLSFIMEAVQLPYTESLLNTFSNDCRFETIKTYVNIQFDNYFISLRVKEVSVDVDVTLILFYDFDYAFLNLPNLNTMPNETEHTVLDIEGDSTIVSIEDDFLCEEELKKNSTKNLKSVMTSINPDLTNKKDFLQYLYSKIDTVEIEYYSKSKVIKSIALSDKYALWRNFDRKSLKSFETMLKNNSVVYTKHSNTSYTLYI